MKVYCKKSKDMAFTAGMIYEIVNYRIIDNDGIPRPVLTKKGEQPIRSIEDIKNFKNGNWSWIGEFLPENTIR